MPYTTISQNPNFTFPQGTLDVRGWEVRTAQDNEKVGKVHDLVLGDGGQFRYLEVDTGGFFTAKRVLLPFGWAQVDEREDVIWVPGMTKEQLKELPEYRGDLSAITNDYEARIRRVGPQRIEGSQHYSHEEFYGSRARTLRSEERGTRITRSEEELAIGKRAVEAGEAAIRKTIETERVRESVPVTREEVTIERHPVEAGATGDVELREDEIRVPIMEEEVIVEKRVVPKEEVVVQKHAVEETKEVEAELRKERIDANERGRTTKGRTTRKREDEERRQ